MNSISLDNFKVYLVRASNKSALTATEMFLREAERLRKSLTPGEIDASPFFSAIIKKLAEEEERKPGTLKIDEFRKYD